jgi:knotted carbamoyltransferase YgeW
MKTSESLLDRVRRIATPNDGLVDRDVLLTWDLSNDAIATLHDLAGALRAAALEGLSLRAFDTGLAVSIFRDKSTRTRYAFRAACNLLGLATEELDESTSQVAHGETARETAAMIGFFTEVVGVRDDLFLGEGHTGMQATAASLEESHRAGALLQRPSVLNLQCDLDHPTQSMADLAHLAHHFGGVERLQGKKLVMSWAHSPSYGKPLSVPQGIVALMTRFGMDVVLAHPEGYELEAGPLEAAQGFAAKSGGRFRVTHAMDEAFEGADVVYPKSWAPGWIMRERTKLHRGGAGAALAGPRSVLADVHELMSLAGYQEVVDKTAETGLKVNISWHFFYPASSTTPWQLDGVIRAMLADGYRRRPDPRLPQPHRGHRRPPGRAREQADRRGAGARPAQRAPLRGRGVDRRRDAVGDLARRSSCASTRSTPRASRSRAASSARTSSTCRR